jgi:hypothetical protein
MSEVTVSGVNVVSITALADPAFIIKISAPGEDDKYIVTKAVWIYENSTNAVVQTGWLDVEAVFDDLAKSSANVVSAVKIDDPAIFATKVRSKPQ